MADTSKDHSQLLNLAKEILREYQSLSQQLQNLQEVLSLQEYQFYAARFDDLQASFNNFTSQFRSAGFPEDADIRDAREKLSQCFTQFYLLRTGFFNQYAVRSPELEAELELVYTPSEEEPDEEPEHLAEEEAGQLPEEGSQEETERPKRRVRKPRALGPSQQIRQQTQRETAAVLGMQLLPDQPVTEADLIRYQHQLEEQQRILAETSAENLHREKEWLASYQEQMKQAISFERLESHHIDMSREGTNAEAPVAPDTPPAVQQPEIKKAGPGAAAAANTSSTEPDASRGKAYLQWQEQQAKGGLPPMEPGPPPSSRCRAEASPAGSSTTAPESSPGRAPAGQIATQENTPPGTSVPGPDASRNKAYRQWQEQQTRGELPPVEPIQTALPQRKPTDRSNASCPQNSGSPAHRYQLSKITTQVGAVSCMAFSAAARKAFQSTENDSVNGLITGSYYLSTAAGAAHSVLTKPAGPLIRSAKAVTSTELVRINREPTRRYQDLKHRIYSVQRQLADLPTAQSRQARQQRQQLQGQLSELQKQLPAAERELARARRVQQFLHERELDKELVQQLKVKKRIPRSEKHLKELSQRILRDAKRDMAQKYGDLASLSDQAIKSRIGNLTEEAGRMKLQIRQLERKGSLLTVGERKLLMKLKARNKDIGNEVARLTGLSRARKDYLYKEGRLNAVTASAGRHRQRLASGTRLVRSLALRPLRADPESNTEGLAYVIETVSDPRARKAAKAAVTAPIKTAGWVLRHTAPGAYNKFLLTKNTVSEKLHHAVTAPQRILQRAGRKAAKAVSNAVPSGVKTAVKKAGAPVRYLHRKYDTLLRSVNSVKRWFASTRVGMGLVRMRILTQNIGALLRAIGAVSKSAFLWIIGILVGLLLLISVAGSVLNLLSLMMTTILSTAEPKPSGKVNLAPYAQIIQTEMTKFSKQIEQLSDKYEEDPNYDNVKVTYRTKVNNTREMLSMMAVRMKQELDLGTNTEIYDYLRALFDASHTFAIAKHEYTCSGCEYIQKQVDLVWDATLGEYVPVYEWVLNCPGHTDVEFVVDVTFFDGLFSADTYVTQRTDWEGWTDENIEWCMMIYEMDWTELYDGVVVPGGTTPPVMISSENEEKVWNYLQSLTGNAYATAGIMGHLYAFSELNPTNLEDLYEDVLGYDDETYTSAVDSNSYTQFQDDNAGYGLAQWSDPVQKAELYADAQSYGRSIGDLSLQLAFLKRELSQGDLLASLQGAATVQEASDIYLDYLSGGSSSGETIRATRAEYGSYFYNKFVLGVSAEGTLTEKQIAVIRVATDSESYGIAATGGYCQRWAAQVYAVAGFALDSSCCAYHSGLAHGVSGDWDNIPPGAAVYGYAGNKYGHVGIYVGNGLVYHNVGGVAVDTLEDWIKANDGFAWGWEGGTDLTVPD